MLAGDEKWIFLTKEQKEEHRVAALKWLHDMQLPYTSHNNGLHLKITIKEKIIDFWPTTGRFKHNNQYFDGNLDHLKHLTNLNQPKDIT